MKLVAVDIGGTHARFALADVAAGQIVSLGEPVTLNTADHASFEAAWTAFGARQSTPLPRNAAIAVACPVRGDTLQLTNNPWTIRPGLIGASLGVDAHVLINDFAAIGHAVAQLTEEHFAHICGPGAPLRESGTITIVGPGTGLGVAAVLRDHGRHHVIATEGGHLDFAPIDAIDDAILALLRQRHGRVSLERVVSGPGLSAIHEVLAAIEGSEVPPRSDRELWAAALAGDDRLATAALDRFCMALGSVAGDLALAHGPGAVVIAGGLGLRLADHLPRSGFAERFVAKGRFEPLMSSVPVRRIIHPQPGLYGAAAAFAQEYA